MNWTKTTTNASLKKDAEKELKKIKREKKGKKTRLVKVSDRPLTYKEIEIED